MEKTRQIVESKVHEHTLKIDYSGATKGKFLYRISEFSGVE